ncbi:uncharacterized protein LODBEIA_P23370 [Lodderomyces beijingensis]|uniref:DUF676 domain-containing protein n=1 Tax=Lodderomyces beijingensis TaxID=1775926 RepID=A0ABP0ZIZ2_9ASCO
MPTHEPSLWYRDRGSLRLGEVNRYVIEYKYSPCGGQDVSQIHFRVKNIENSGVRTVHMISGPFILYCHVVPCNYNPRRKFEPQDPQANTEVVYANQIKPNQAFNATLVLNKNSLLETRSEDGQPVEIYQWQVDLVSQIVITKKTKVDYDLMIGEDVEIMKKLGCNVIEKALTSIVSLASDREAKQEMEIDSKFTDNHVFNPLLSVVKSNADDIWTKPPEKPLEPVHLIIITHGLFSNLTSDMLYIKDQLESKVTENIMVRGFRYNAGRTEKGVRKLGTNVAEYIVDVIENSPHRFSRISFIAHSLGGLVQLYAIKYILVTKGVDFFDKLNIEPVNFISLASPFLGIINEMNPLIAWVFDLGALGKTGRDLTISKRLPAWKDIERFGEHNARDSFKPVLETLPEDPLQTFLSKFKRLTLYANAINDGIVPLRTAALLYLDYEALGDVNELIRTNRVTEHPELENDHHDVESVESGNTVSEVPSANDGRNEHETSQNDREGAGVKESLRSAQVEQKKGSQKQRAKYGAGKHRDFRNLNLPTKAKHFKRQKRYKHFNIKGLQTEELNAGRNGDGGAKAGAEKEAESRTESESCEDTASLIIPPRASAIESAINTLICPLPSTEFILDPASRHPVIFHDRYYHLDKAKENKMDANDDKQTSWFADRFFRFRGKWKLHKQVLIANKYHTEKLTWRKILVNLPPDAHNNISVRRRFANGYGWGVINHMCENLFECKPKGADEVISETHDELDATEELRAKI